MKKILFYSMLFGVLAYKTNAQMVDLMGSMAVGGAMDRGSVNAIGTMNKQLKKTQLISDIQMKVIDIMTTYGGQYKRLKPTEINSGGVKVIFSSAKQGNSFQATVNNPNRQTCHTLLSARWEGVEYLNVESDGRMKQLSLSEAESSADTICRTVKSISIIYQ